jgi:hypothetical protein
MHHGNATDDCGSSDRPPNEEHLVGEGALFMFLGNDNLTTMVTSVSSIACAAHLPDCWHRGIDCELRTSGRSFTRLLAPHFPDQGRRSKPVRRYLLFGRRRAPILDWKFMGSPRLTRLLLVCVRAIDACAQADLRGIYIYTNDVSSLSKAAAAQLTQSFSLPGVD